MKTRQEMVLTSEEGSTVTLKIQRDLVAIRDHYMRLLSTVVHFQVFSELHFKLAGSSFDVSMLEIESRELNDSAVYIEIMHTALDPSFLSHAIYCKWMYIEDDIVYKSGAWQNFDDMIKVDELLTVNS